MRTGKNMTTIASEPDVTNDSSSCGSNDTERGSNERNASVDVIAATATTTTALTVKKPADFGSKKKPAPKPTGTTDMDTEGVIDDAVGKRTATEPRVGALKETKDGDDGSVYGEEIYDLDAGHVRNKRICVPYEEFLGTSRPHQHSWYGRSGVCFIFYLFSF